MILARPAKRILHIDEHPICHYGLSSLVDDSPSLEIARYAATTQFGTLQDPVDLIVLEISSSRPKGISALRDLKTRLNATPILVLSSYDERIYADRCLKAGASGYVMKSAPMDEILNAIETVAEGELYASESVKSLMISRMAGMQDESQQASFDALSDRELLIVEQIGLSKNNKEIAQALQISIKTIESHRSRIKAKLQLSSPQDLIRYAMRLYDH